jgi:TPR repeat protein
MKGKGVPQDYKLALYWTRKSAEKCDELAQNNLGEMYEKGEGVKKNLVQAYSWYTCAIEFKDKQARKNLASINKIMTPAQIEKARSLAKTWIKKHKDSEK